ncbi:uncharacterized protein LOC108739630 isoform X2 [Agrilus planipennis]|uniref:Uncharacterized protein LOC108739630 isoform X2 n=1 Tax=Agrilus planipennis TaxID=224129 RepID=A0A1W4X9V6_AGRPL|nr:uncharacterized protein LOC108739630 isoform X2 [Agrilus planipennis]
MTSDSNRSLSAGISIPQWMKSKISDSKFDSEDFLSPPDNDDSFLYIYPKKLKDATSNSKINNNVEIVTDQKNNFSTSETTEKGCSSSRNFKGAPKVDYEKYTAPCKPYLINSDSQLKSSHFKLSPDQKIKSNGTDDGFKGEAAKCGSSVIKMAHQIVSGKLSRNESENSLNEEPATPPPNFYSSKRRNSKSLPASPLSTPNTSPKSQRKMNKYFNGVFFGNENYQGSWILSSLLKKRDISKSVDQIVEVDELDNHTQNVIKVAEEFNSKITQAEQKIKNIYVPKPEEIREMNFWSPTSM